MIDTLNKTRFGDRHARVPEWVMEAFQTRLDDSSVTNYAFCGNYVMYVEPEYKYEDEKPEVWRATIDCDTWDYWDTERDPTKQRDPITLNEFKIEKL